MMKIDFKKTLNKLFESATLSREEASNVLFSISNGEFKDSQIAAFLTVYSMRSITVAELMGFRDAMLEMRIKVDLAADDLIDLCGTGGDGKDTFNISTISSFIIAGAGYKVAKHGNYGVSSLCGSSNVLEHLGAKFTKNPEILQKQLDKANICILHAPLFHPAMKNVAPIRQELSFKTFFNMLGPMVNPSAPMYQVVGVYNLELARLYNYIYQSGPVKYAIIHTIDGYDEIALTAPLKIYQQHNESLKTPMQLGFSTLNANQLHGGESIAQAAEIFVNCLQNKGSVAQEAVLICTAALAIQLINNKNWEHCVEEAKYSLKSGKAFQCFTTYMNLN